MRAWFPLLLAPALFVSATALASPHGRGKAWQLWLGPGDARLGVELLDMSEDLRKYFGAPQDRGVLVDRVEPDSAGAQAGLRAGDVILEVGGQKVEDPTDVVAALRGKKAGDKVSLQVVRNHANQTLTATLKQGKGREEMELMLGPGEGLRGLRWLAEGDMKKELERTRNELRELQKRIEKLEKVR